MSAKPRRRWWLILLLAAAPSAATAAERITQLKLPLPDGRQLPAEVRAPASANEPLPAVMLFGGFQGTAEILERVTTGRPVVRASFRYPWTPPRHVRAGNLRETLLDFRRAVDDTIDGIVALTAALRARDDVDPARISIVGASAGAPFAVFGAARAQISGLVIVQGFGEVPAVIGRQFELKLREDHGAWVAPLTRLLGEAIGCYLDLPRPETDARRLSARQRVLMVTATADERIPAHATEALWQALGEGGASIDRLDLPGAHLRGYGDPAIDEILKLSLRWLEQSELL